MITTKTVVNFLTKSTANILKKERKKAIFNFLKLSFFNLRSLLLFLLDFKGLGLSQMTFLTEEYSVYVGLPYGTDLIFILRSAR